MTQNAILVVDDEPEVGQFIASVLNRSGFRAILATCARDALTRYHALPVDLVLTDIVMNDVSGPALVKTLMNIRADVRVMYMTGYGREHLERFGELPGSSLVLNKPFTPAELTAAVRSALGVEPAHSSTGSAAV